MSAQSVIDMALTYAIFDHPPTLLFKGDGCALLDNPELLQPLRELGVDQWLVLAPAVSRPGTISINESEVPALLKQFDLILHF